MTVETLSQARAAALVPELVGLLQEAVAGGASIGFLPPVSDTVANAYWRDAIREIGTGKRVILAALDGERVVGSVQLRLADQANAAHRAEVAKLFVAAAHRGKGIGAELMNAAEAEASRLKRTLLILDVKAGEPAEALYQRLGWQRAGMVPRYSKQADGSLADTVIYWREV